MDTTDLAAARVRRFLETEPVIWLSSTRADGAPHLVPTWFVWDGEAIVIMSKPGAVKVRNLRADPRAMLALGDAEDDFDVGLLEARAEVQAAAAPRACPRVSRRSTRPHPCAGPHAGPVRPHLRAGDPAGPGPGAGLARSDDAAVGACGRTARRRDGGCVTGRASA